MTKIEEKICSAVRHGTPMCRGNTSVTPMADVNGFYMWLHGKPIALLCNGKLYLSDCGQAPRITSSRMNAVLDGLNLPFHVSVQGGKMQLEGRGKPIHFHQCTINMTNVRVTE